MVSTVFQHSYHSSVDFRVYWTTTWTLAFSAPFVRNRNSLRNICIYKYLSSSSSPFCPACEWLRNIYSSSHNFHLCYLYLLFFFQYTELTDTNQLPAVGNLPNPVISEERNFYNHSIVLKAQLPHWQAMRCFIKKRPFSQDVLTCLTLTFKLLSSDLHFSSHMAMITKTKYNILIPAAIRTLIVTGWRDTGGWQIKGKNLKYEWRNWMTLPPSIGQEGSLNGLNSMNMMWITFYGFDGTRSHPSWTPTVWKILDWTVWQHSPSQSPKQ